MEGGAAGHGVGLEHFEGTMRKVGRWVLARTTLGAAPASQASFQRRAQRHQRSPGLRPVKPNSGRGVERSLPRGAGEGEEGSSVTRTQTVWRPRSEGPVLQQPSRKKPVIGSKEQGFSGSPRTLRLGSSLGLHGQYPVISR